MHMPEGLFHTLTMTPPLLRYHVLHLHSSAHRHQGVRGQRDGLALLVLQHVALLVLLQHRLRVAVVRGDQEAPADLLNRLEQRLQHQRKGVGFIRSRRSSMRSARVFTLLQLTKAILHAQCERGAP